MRVRIEPVSPHAAHRVTSEPSIGLAWLWRLRWATAIVQAGAIVLGVILLDLELPVPVLVSIVSITAVSNVFLVRLVSAETASKGMLGAVLLLDASLHTTLLYWSGGAANPFSSLFIVYVAVAALLLGARWALAMTVLTSLSFGALFLIPAERLGPHALHFAAPMHLRGMWVAYVLSASFVAFFVTRVATALRERERELLSLHDYTANVERVASLGTIAAGAAHELGSPLASIAVSATELAEQLAGHEHASALELEARQIRTEVSRCRQILDRLAAGAGQHRGESLLRLTFGEITTLVLDELGPKRGARVTFRANSDRIIVCPSAGLVQALVNLIQNAIDASTLPGEEGAIVVSFDHSETELCFEIKDQGRGIREDAVTKLGEPFFTTKPPGQGMGLGLYVAGAFARQVSGTLHLDSVVGRGTSAVLRIPILSCESVVAGQA